MVDNSIEIGDKVYVGGLFGVEYELINNKIGVVEKIYYTSTNSEYIAFVNINNNIEAINFAFLFEIKQLLNDNFKFKKNIDLLDFYLKKNMIISKPELAINEYGSSYCIFLTRENNFKHFFLTGFN